VVQGEQQAGLGEALAGAVDVVGVEVEADEHPVGAGAAEQFDGVAGPADGAVGDGVAGPRAEGGEHLVEQDGAVFAGGRAAGAARRHGRTLGAATVGCSGPAGRREGVDVGTVVFAPEVVPLEGPLVFLAGPIQGAPPWQEDAARLIQSLDDRLNVASPRRRGGEFVLLDEAGYAGQVDWETRHLRRAAESGVILFWLARERELVPGRAYAQTTRFELGEWKEQHRRDGVRLVVGIEAGFSGARYVRRRFGQDCPGMPLCDSLEETCRAAVKLATG
jgi:hypothetical protein